MPERARDDDRDDRERRSSSSPCYLHSDARAVAVHGGRSRIGLHRSRRDAHADRRRFQPFWRLSSSAFADTVMMFWNVHQPLLTSLYCGSLLLFVLTANVAFTKHEGESGSVATAAPLLLAILGSATALLSFLTMNRVVLAISDPDWTAPLADVSLRRITPCDWCRTDWS
jgi:hypothetical protein